MEIQTKTCNPANYGGVQEAADYIVIHWTSNEGDTAKNNADYFAREVVKASAHYFVDENEIWNSVPADCIAYHVGATIYKHALCRNRNSIGVEICMTGKNYVLRKGSIANAVQLVRQLMKKCDIPIENVIRHYDVTGKDCPSPMVNNPDLWNDFKAALTVQENKMRYKTYEDMPTWAQPTVSKLVRLGLLKGDQDGVLDMSEDMLRVLVINDRAGMYK